MKKQNHYIAIGGALGMLVLIFDGKTAISGATDGIQLCLNTIIPSLFPFILLSILMTNALRGQDVRLLRPITAACKLPLGSEAQLIISFLGGYPVGAQNIAQLYRSGQLTHNQAARMIAFCNNAGPAFIFGVLGTIFTNQITPWLVWFIHIASALIVGLLLPGDEPDSAVRTQQNRIKITDALTMSIKVMSLICGWIILMRMILTFMESWFLWLLPHPLRIIITGVLELSNGCIRLSELENEGIRFLIAAGILSFGGICVTLQTASVADGIPMKLYFLGKLLQCCISVFLAYFLQFFLPDEDRWQCSAFSIVTVVLMLIILLRLRYSKKSSSIPVVISV